MLIKISQGIKTHNLVYLLQMFKRLLTKLMDRELHRLEAVKRFKELELDPAVTKDLNDIVNLAAQICEYSCGAFYFA